MTAPVRSYGEKWHGYRSVPPPPSEIARQMGAAGKAGDDARLGLLKRQYEEWLEEQGYRQPQLGWPTRGEEDR